MPLTKHAYRSLLIVTLLTVSACVTINVYFPASQAERAAERIVDEILDQSETAPAEPKDARLLQDISAQLLMAVANLIINDAHAAEPDFSVNSPKISRLEGSMKQRHAQLSEFYAAGAIGFDKQGLVAWRDKKAVGLKDRGRLGKLMNAENKDRNSLYQAIADANGHPEWENQIRQVFARKWVERAPAGWWYQNSKGSWKKK